jgi:GNAT superfamily N-acetyltransferase
MVANLFVRPAQVDELAALEALQWRASLMWEEYREALLAHPDAIEIPSKYISDGFTIVAELKKTLVGFAIVVPREDGNADLDGLFVEPTIWRAGIGRHLISEAEIMAATRGASFLYVTANPRAQEFYLACGFMLIGEEATRFGIGLTMRTAISNAHRKGSA